MTGRVDSPRLEGLERLAARVELEIRAERRRLRNEPGRAPGRPPLRRPDDHGTERDYQAHRKAGEIACDVCKAGHALYERRRSRTRKVAQRASGLVPAHRDEHQLTIYDALREA